MPPKSQRDSTKEEHQHPLAPNRIQHLDNQRTQQTLRRNRAAAVFGINFVEVGLLSATLHPQSSESRAQWMMRRRPTFQTFVTEQLDCWISSPRIYIDAYHVFQWLLLF